MRRIVHYYPDAMGHSGVTFALWSWARAQALTGTEVEIVHAGQRTGSADVPFVRKDSPPGLSARAVPHHGRRRMTRIPIQFQRHLGRDDLLVLHEGWVPSNLVAAAAARRGGVPYVVMPHGVYDRTWMRYLRPPIRLRTRFERQLVEGAAAVHVFFDSEIDDVRAFAPRATFVSVPTGFDLPSERWSGGGGYLGWLGRIDPVHKGLDLLVDAIVALPRDQRPLLRIRGYDYKGGLDRLRRLIARRGAGKWIQVEGSVNGDAKTRFLQLAEGYVHPSRWESHSIALLENLALGVPCAVTDTIHIAATLDRSQAAILSRPTSDALSGALAALTHAGGSMGARGRALVADAFNWSRIMPRYFAIIGRLGLA